MTGTVIARAMLIVRLILRCLRGGDLVKWETEVAKCKQTKGWLDDFTKMKAELVGGVDMIKTIAALFVEEFGIYAELSFIDLWFRQRDARKYDGWLPVIAHPPCQLWGNMAAVNFARWGGEHNRPGNDGGCFSSALASVRRCCGVLEHPAKSKAWRAFNLPHPTGQGWSQGSGNEWVCEVWQSAYGHRANKATWLFYKGRPPLELEWERPKGSHQIGYPDSRGKSRNKPTLSKREANATPRPFRDALLALTQHSVS